MKFSDSFLQAITRFQDDAGGTFGPHWSVVIDNIVECIRDKGDLPALLNNFSDFFNYGIYNEISGPAEQIRAAIANDDLMNYPLRVHTFTEWFSALYAKIMQGDRKDILEKEIQCTEIQRKKLRKELTELQQARKDAIMALLDEKTRQAKMRLIDGLIQMDDLMYSGLQMKKAISLGTFFSVAQKRDHFDREKQLQKEVVWFNGFVDTQADKNGIVEVHKIQDRIIAALSSIIDKETAIEKLAAEMQSIEKMKDDVSPAEIESRVRKEIEYLRELVKLSARRLRLSPCSLITAEQKLFSFKKIREYLDRIQEFDPEIFHNDRVPMFGKPEIIILPGNGSAIYDWKNNCIIVPLVIPGDNPMASIATGIIDYRIDVDEDKNMTYSYSQLAERKTIRSTVDLRAALTKDYIIWMTSEYNGFRVLPKGIKDWFEHTIAPSRSEIYTPPELRTFALSPVDFEEQVKKIESSLSAGVENIDEKTLWAGSVLLYQKGKFDVSLEMLQTLLKNNPNFALAWYNAGLVASKLMRKQEAIDAFTEYTKRWPQCWWARIARDHLNRLRV